VLTLNERSFRAALRRFSDYCGVPYPEKFTSCLGTEIAGLPLLYYRSAKPWSKEVAVNWDILMTSTRTKENGGRFNPPGTFDVLYTSGDHITALAEGTRALEKAGFDPRKAFPRTTHVIEVRLSRVINLYDEKILSRLGITTEHLLGDWQADQLAGKIAISQKIGLIIHEETRVEGMIVPTTTKTGLFNLDIFVTKKMLRSGAIKVVDPGIE